MDGFVNALDQFTPLIAAFAAHINKGVIVTDYQGRILFHNRAASAMLGDYDLDSASRIHEMAGADAHDAVTRISPNENRVIDDATLPCRRFEQTVTRDGVRHVVDVQSSTVPVPGESDPLHLLVLGEAGERAAAVIACQDDEHDLVTQDPRMREIAGIIDQIAPNKASVLIQGESGTGKSLIARMIHNKSERSDKPLIEINCAAIPEHLLESEMFGHVKGAFTGATEHRQGRLQAAHGGTLFLDEISQMPLHLQPKLLKALEEQAFHMVGSDATTEVDVRIIAASNQDLRALVAKGEFRADLYYRLAVIPLDIPALRDRPGDIPLLARYISNNLASHAYPGHLQCEPEALRLLLDYPWPGNVRELANAVEHGMILAENGRITPGALPASVREYGKSGLSPDAADPCEEQIDPACKEILDALRQTNWNRGEAARLLGIDRSTLWRRMHRLGLDKPA